MIALTIGPCSPVSSPNVRSGCRTAGGTARRTPGPATAGGKGAGSDGIGGRVNPPSPSDPYSSFQSVALTNDATGLVLNNAHDVRSEGNPIITWPNTPGAPNQAWYFTSGGYLNAIPVFSLDAGTSSLDITESPIVENLSNHAVRLHRSQGSVPSGGFWFYLDMIPGPNDRTVGKLDVMLVNTTTERCLAAPDQPDTQLVTAACNTTDKAQWWTVTRAKR